MRGWNGVAFYMAHTAPTDESSSIAFNRNFNPDLKYDSEYHSNLNGFIKCVEKNSSKDLTED